MASDYQCVSYANYNLPSGNNLFSADATFNIGSAMTDDNFWNVNDQVADGNVFTYIGCSTVGGHTFLIFQDTGDSNDRVTAYSPTAPASAYPATYSGFGSLDTTPKATCFCAGTRIATTDGECAVETLSIGDQLLDQDGHMVPIKWIGRQALHKLFSGPHMQPVRIRAGALGNGLPHSDLTVTADHGMVIDGLVINASALVNGTTIDFVPMDELEDSFTVYHIETENHDVILANGAAAETFVDAVTRGHFDNYQEYLDIYGAERIIPEMDRPRISTQRLLPDAIKARLGIAEHSDSFEMLRQA